MERSFQELTFREHLKGMLPFWPLLGKFLRHAYVEFLLEPRVFLDICTFLTLSNYQSFSNTLVFFV